MSKLQFLLSGGLGNQIFQYLASKYITKQIPDVIVNYSLSDYILKGYRSFEINKIIIEKIKIDKEYKSNSSKLLRKIIKNIHLLNNMNTSKLLMKFKFLETIDENELNHKYKFKNTLLDLHQKLKSIKHLNSTIKIVGYWQNPSCYIDNIKNINLLFEDTKKNLPSNFQSIKYITIHIRRGDYLVNKENYFTYFSRFSEIQFILGALQLIPKEFESIPVYCISDDYEWALKYIPLISNNIKNKLFILDNKDPIKTWSILNNSLINIISNSTFSYTAALLNTNNLNNKLRCILPKWVNFKESSFEKGWLSPSGFIEL